MITKTIIYIEDTIDIHRHMVTKNSYEYDLQAPSTRHMAYTRQKYGKYELCA